MYINKILCCVEGKDFDKAIKTSEIKMSGASRKSQYRKHLTDQVLNEFPEPNFDANEHIAQILASRGGNLYEVDIGKDGEELAMLPAKFNKLVWVKRGDFVIVQGEQEATENDESGKGNKVRFLIKHVLYKVC